MIKTEKEEGKNGEMFWKLKRWKSSLKKKEIHAKKINGKTNS